MAKHIESWSKGMDPQRLPKALRKFAALIDNAYTEDDGCFQDSAGRDVPGLWVELTPGLAFAASDCGTMHEATLRAVVAGFDRIELNQDGEVLMRALLTLDQRTLAVLGDAIEEGRPVAAWEDGGPMPTRYMVKMAGEPTADDVHAHWGNPGGPADFPLTWRAYVNAYTLAGALRAARAKLAYSYNRVGLMVPAADALVAVEA